MIRFKNVAYQSVSGAATGITTGTIKFPLWVNNFKFPVKVRKITFQIPEKGANGTSFTVDLHKNGTTVLSTVPVCTLASLGANYSVKFDTAKELTATAPGGVSALPVLSSTDATITVKPGDALELSTTVVGTYSTTLPKYVATVVLEYVPA